MAPRSPPGKDLLMKPDQLHGLLHSVGQVCTNRGAEELFADIIPIFTDRY
jgi:hypothetical protein